MTPNERLRIARERAGFETAVAAADALGITRSTYLGHENGHRNFPAKRAPIYARKFGVQEEWLLYGKGDFGPAEPQSEIFEVWDHIPPEKREHALAVLKTFAEDDDAPKA